jgi:hypothetical protein
MLFRPIKQKTWFFVFPHPERGAVFSSRDDFGEEIPMSFEGILIWGKKIGNPGAMT